MTAQLSCGGFPAGSIPKTIRDDNQAGTGAPKLGFARVSIPADEGATVLTVGLLGRIDVTCTDPAQPFITYFNTQGRALLFAAVAPIPRKRASLAALS
jgi:hypothetical protein